MALLLCALLLSLLCVAHGQQVLAVSSFQTCTSVSFGNTQLSCANNTQTATVLLVRAGYSAQSLAQSASFEFGVSSAPTSAAASQVGSSNRCQPSSNAPNQCGYTQQTSVRMQLTRPVLRYQLVQTSLQVPFLYYYRLVDAACTTQSCTNSRSQNLNGCTLTGSVVSRTFKSAIGTIPTADQVIAQYHAQVASNNNYDAQIGRYAINCRRYLKNQAQYVDPDGTPRSPGEAAIVYTFDCRGTKVQMYAAFYQIMPMCQVFKIQNPPDIVSRLTVSVTSTDPVTRANTTETLEIDTNQYEVARATADGRMLVKIANVQSATGQLGPNIEGLIVVCGRNTVDNATDSVQVEELDMVPRGANPILNPWQNVSVATRRWALPTPANIRIVQQKPASANEQQFFYYINAQGAPCVGRQCGQLGVQPNLYSTDAGRLFFDQYTNLFASKPVFSYNNILNLGRVKTCVPGFGDAQDCNSTTPCTAQAEFVNLNEGNATQRQDTLNKTGTREFLPLQWNAEEPNIWLHGAQMFVDLPLDAEYEVSISTRSDFLGVIGRVTTARFDRTQGTGCSINTDTFNSDGFLSARVCTDAQTDGEASAYLVYARCSSFSGLTPVQQQTGLLGPGECQTVTFTFEAGSSLGPSQCTLSLGSPSATVTFAPGSSLTLDEVQVQCVDNMLPPSTLILNNDTIRFPNGTVAPGGNGSQALVQGKAARNAWIGVLVVVVVIVIGLVGLVLFIGVQARRAKNNRA